MTISVETNKSTYSGDDATVAFSSGFKIFAATDLVVELVNDSTDVVTVQVKDTDYTVGSITAPSSTVTVTMTTAPATGETLVIRRNQSQLQSTDYVENDNFPAQTHENNLDKLVMMVQEHEEVLARVLRLNPSQSLSTYLPTLADNAGKVVSVNTAEDGFTLSSITDAALDINSLDAAAIAATDTLPFYDVTATGNKKITFANLEATIDHDNLAGFVSNEHINWTSSSSNFSTSGSMTVTGSVDFSGATNFEIPNGTSVTTDAAGELAMDTNGDGSTITHGILKAYDGTNQLYGVLVTNYPSSDNDVITYDSGTNSAKWMAPSLGGAGINNVIEDVTPQLGGDLDLNGNNIDFPTTANISDCLDEDNMASNSATALATQQSIKAYVDAEDANIASDTLTFTNKTFDANATGNSLSNVDVADLANGTDGELITWDAAGAPATVGAGTSGQVLTSNGAGAAPTMQTLNVGSMILIETQTASSSATLDFTTSIDSTYDRYVLLINGFVPATDGVDLLLRTSTDGGSTFDSGASDYAHTVHTSWTTAGSASTGDTSIRLHHSIPAMGSAAGESINGNVYIYSPSNASLQTMISYDTLGFTTTGSPTLSLAHGGGRRNSAADVDGIRLFFSSGNIASGSASLYGIAK